MGGEWVLKKWGKGKIGKLLHPKRKPTLWERKG